jgi:hypothetical protein
MEITENQLARSLNFFVELYNEDQRVAACHNFYAKQATMVYEASVVSGVDNIYRQYEKLAFDQILNPLILSSRIKEDGSEAMIQAQFTMALKSGDAIEFHRVCSFLLFGIENDELVKVIAEIGMTQKQL